MSTKAAENNNLVPAQPKTKDEGTPENNAKIHVRDATEKTEDIKPKQVGPENAKEILTGALAQKVSEFNARFKKKAADSMVPAAKPTVNDIHMGGFAAGTGTVGAALGGAAGGTLGGLAGLIDPGTYEENGVKKQRGRLMGGLMGAGKGALGGAVGGGAVGGLGGAGLLQMLRNMENARAPKTAASKSANLAWPSAIENANTWLQNATAGDGAGRINYHNLALMGAGLGSLGGALTAPKGKMLKRTLQGAGLGGAAGLGAAFGGQMGANIIGGANPGKHIANRLLMAGMGGAGALGAHHLANKALHEVTDDTETNDFKKRKQEDKDLADMRTGLAKISRATKAAALTDYGSVGGGAMVGGLGGAAVGGLAGLVSPGQDTEYDNYGRPVGSKQRSRLGAALRGALGGGAIGGLGGAAAGHFMGPQTNQALAALQPYLNSAQEYGKGMYNKMFPQKDNIAVPAGSVAKRDEAGAPITVAPKAIPAASSPTADPKAGIDLPPTKPPSQGFFPSLINGAAAGPW